MTPEKLFEEWWKNANFGLPDKIATQTEYTLAKLAWYRAFRLGQKSGMERAAEIAESWTEYHVSVKSIGPRIAKAILAEKDKL